MRRLLVVLGLVAAATVCVACGGIEGEQTCRINGEKVPCSTVGEEPIHQSLAPAPGQIQPLPGEQSTCGCVRYACETEFWGDLKEGGRCTYCCGPYFSNEYCEAWGPCYKIVKQIERDCAANTITYYFDDYASTCNGQTPSTPAP